MSEMHGGPAAAAAGDGEGSSGPRSWAELNFEEQGKLLKERLKKYTQKVIRHRPEKLPSICSCVLAVIHGHFCAPMLASPSAPMAVWYSGAGVVLLTRSFPIM